MRGMHGDIQRRQAYSIDPLLVALLEIGERGEVPRRQTTGGNRHRGCTSSAKPLGQPLVEAEFAAIGAARTDGGTQFTPSVSPSVARYRTRIPSPSGWRAWTSNESSAVRTSQSRNVIDPRVRSLPAIRYRLYAHSSAIVRGRTRSTVTMCRSLRNAERQRARLPSNRHGFIESGRSTILAGTSREINEQGLWELLSQAG